MWAWLAQNEPKLVNVSPNGVLDRLAMAKRHWRQANWRWLAVALLIAGTADLLPVPAGAQFFYFGQQGPSRPPPPPPPRGFFNFPFFRAPGPGFYQERPPPQ